MNRASHSNTINFTKFLFGCALFLLLGGIYGYTHHDPGPYGWVHCKDLCVREFVYNSPEPETSIQLMVTGSIGLVFTSIILAYHTSASRRGVKEPLSAPLSPWVSVVFFGIILLMIYLSQTYKGPLLALFGLG